MSGPVADIAVSVSVNKTFHYAVPGVLQSRLVRGSRVLVPFGARRIAGTVLGFPAQPETKSLKVIIEELGKPLTQDLLDLALWISDYYVYPIGRTIEVMIPKAISRVKPKTTKCLRLKPMDSLPDYEKLLSGKKQKELLRILHDHSEVSADQMRSFSAQTINSLCRLGIAEIIETNAEYDGPPEQCVEQTGPVLMPEQAQAVAMISHAINAGLFAAFLLHGVTGSGKTEVYLQAINQLRGTGKGTIVLVPEIALTPQLLSRFRQRFGNRIAVLHSRLTDRERTDEYRRIQSGAVDIAIGARSAVFAPFPRVGLFIVDEEHESSYKQDEGLRYHARDVAVMRAKIQKAVVVLGSATPSLESYYNAETGKYAYLTLPTRVDNRPLPKVIIIDMKCDQKRSIFSERLIAESNQRLEKKEQTVLLLNRRGYSSVLMCRDCGKAIKCPSCSVSLTYHKSNRMLKCHYCGCCIAAPSTCPACSGINLELLGTGTQKIEEELELLFPQAQIRRMDSDTVKQRQAYDSLIAEVDRKEVDILLGTQMIAKGHDFPSVTLVGIVDADVGLNLPDFRSAEKTFQLLTQAAGRAGRGEAEGEVIIQTINPKHYAIMHSRTHDYKSFYLQEFGYRKELNYPPISRMIKLEFKSLHEPHTTEGAKTAWNRIRSLIKGKGVTVLGPAPAPIARVRSQYRSHILLLSMDREKMRYLALEGKRAVEEKHGRTCKVIIDVDPVNLM